MINLLIKSPLRTNTKTNYEHSCALCAPCGQTKQTQLILLFIYDLTIFAEKRIYGIDQRM